jgi:aconitate hydratase 2 / 2-methylisocitrate dehydratase
MDAAQLMKNGYFNIFSTAGARTEMPGYSLCMGNQTRVAAKSAVMSTSTRNFPNRLGAGANMHLASAELAAIAAMLGKLPTVDECKSYMREIQADAADMYRFFKL